MQELFESIKASYNSLWHTRVLGQSIEIVTPMVTTNDSFVSVFVTKRGNDYVVTDGGWISAGYYGFNLDDMSNIYDKLFEYYLDSFGIVKTEGHGRKIFYKKISNRNMVVNAVFELSNFISSVVSGSNIQFKAEKKEHRFSNKVKKYLSDDFKKDSFQFNKGLVADSSIKYGAISNFNDKIQLINFVTGSDYRYYSDSLCRSNCYFDAANNFYDYSKINKKIAILDDTYPKVYDSPQVRELISFLENNRDNILLPWSEKDRLQKLLIA